MEKYSAFSYSSQDGIFIAEGGVWIVWSCVHKWIIYRFKLISVRWRWNQWNEAPLALSLMMVMMMKTSLSADGSSECSPRRRSISGGGASEKSVAVETSSPFKVPVREKWVCVCVFVHVCFWGSRVHSPDIYATLKADFLLRIFGASRWSDQYMKSPQ